MQEQAVNAAGQTWEEARADWWAGLRGFAKQRRKSVEKARSAWTKHAGGEPKPPQAEAATDV